MEVTRTRTLTASTDTYAFANPTTFKDCRWIALRRATGTDSYFSQEIALEPLYDPPHLTEQSDGIPPAGARDAPIIHSQPRTGESADAG